MPYLLFVTLLHSEPSAPPGPALSGLGVPIERLACSEVSERFGYLRVSERFGCLLPAPTSRDVYYELLGRFGLQHGYKKDKELQRKAYRLISLMRRARHIEFDAINDDSYDSATLSSYESPEELYRRLRGFRDTYHKDLMHNQPVAVRVHCEGAGKVRQFYQVASDYCAPVYSPGGWDSLAFKYRTARRVVYEWRVNDRYTVILHAGDLDPDGVGIFESWREDVLAFVEDGLFFVDPEPEEIVTFKRIMTLPEQVPDHGPKPPQARLLGWIGASLEVWTQSPL